MRPKVLIVSAALVASACATVLPPASSAAQTSSTGLAPLLVQDVFTGRVVAELDAAPYVPVEPAPGERVAQVVVAVDDVSTVVERHVRLTAPSDLPLPDLWLRAAPDGNTLTWEAPSQGQVEAVRWDGGQLDVAPDQRTAALPFRWNGAQNVDVLGSAEDGTPFVSSVRLAALDPLTDVTNLVTLRGITQLRRTILKYETYIPDSFVDAPDFGGPTCESGDGSNYSFGGDSRPGPGPLDSSSFRTRVRADRVWANTASLATDVTVSDTTRYRKVGGNYYYESRRNAGTVGIVPTPFLNSNTEIGLEIEHSSGNPYCASSNNIDYSMAGRFGFNGGYYAFGGHEQMPNHQLYLKQIRNDGSTYYELLFNHELVSPNCLNPLYTAVACPQRRWSVTNG